jgi:hypothetical protein
MLNQKLDGLKTALDATRTNGWLADNGAGGTSGIGSGNADGGGGTGGALSSPGSSKGKTFSGGSLRLPDFVTLNINVGGVVGWSGILSVDRYGDLFWSPIGISAGKSLTVVSVSLTAGWMDQGVMPSQTALQNFLSGHGFSFTGGYWGGANVSWSPGNGLAPGIGAVSPQVGGGYNFSFSGPHIGVSW